MILESYSDEPKSFRSGLNRCPRCGDVLDDAVFCDCKADSDSLPDADDIQEYRNRDWVNLMNSLQVEPARPANEHYSQGMSIDADLGASADLGISDDIDLEISESEDE